MEAKNNCAKRTFGLVSGYGSDTESEDSDQEEVIKKQKVGGKSEDEVTIKEDYENDVEEEMPQSKAPSTSLLRARREFEERSMLYSFICSAEHDERLSEENEDDKTEVNKEDTEIKINSKDSGNIKVTAQDAEGDGISAEIKDDGCSVNEKTKSVMKNSETVVVEKTTCAATENPDVVVQDNNENAVVESHAKAVLDNNETAVIENNDKDWEIRAIQAEIETQQKDWEPAYSDDEGTGAEDAAVFKRAKKRAAVMKDLEKETAKPMNRPPGKILPENHVPGEGWKRLQLRAETRVKNFPELYTTYPVHKFPHKDSESR